jgi:hypothetical protein
MVAIVLTELIPGVHLPQIAPAALFAMTVALSLPMLGRTAQFMVGLGTVATVLLVARGAGGLPEVIVAGERGAFLACLILSLSFLRTAASSSPMVSACSAIIVNQPPGRRYLALMGGGHFLGVIMNFGVLNLLGPMVMQGGDGSSAQQAARQRMMLAVVRGFSVAMLWSPTTLAQALIVEAVPGLRWIDLLPFTLSIAVLCAATGYLMERGSAPSAPQPNTPGAPRPYWPLISLCVVISLFLAAVLEVAQQANLSLIFAILPVAPVFSLLWIFIDLRAAGDRRAGHSAAMALGSILRGFPFQANEIVLLGIAGYLGSLVATVLGASSPQAVGMIADMPLLPLAIAMMLLIAAGGQIGVNPVIGVSIIGGILAALPTLPGNPVILGLALSLGWVISHGSSPFSAAALIAGKNMDLPAWQVGYRLNGRYSLVLCGVGTAILACAATVL